MMRAGPATGQWRRRRTGWGAVRAGWLVCAHLMVVLGAAGGVMAGDDQEFFEKRIRPVLVEHCHECHSAGSRTLKGGLRVDVGDGLVRGGDRGPAVVRGDANRSLLLRALSYEDRDLQMPPKGRLPAAVLKDFAEWVARGAPDPREPGAPKTAVTAAGSPKSVHWAFQPLRWPPHGADHGAGNGSRKVDEFLRTRLAEARLDFSPPADRRTLIRRLSFDLTGLPPTEGEVEAFVRDESPGAWERLVERLLASPRYGERWARWWLDLARYADTNGQDENKAMSNAWRYRDWVIRAFNADMAFDRFVTEQLAGDLLPTNGVSAEAVRDRWIATGLLVLGPKMLAEQDKGKLVMDIVDEQIDTVTRATLGLTVSCARCHDHKYDPVTQRDYYALAGVFRSTRTMENLSFVSKFNERWLAADPVVTEWREHRERTEATRKALEQAVRKADEAAGKEGPLRPRDRYPLETVAEIERLEQRRDALRVTAPVEPPRALAVEEAGATNIPVHIRGSHLNLAKEPVPRGAIEGIAPASLWKAPPENGSGRLELARWLTDPNHPLTARVTVNRIWQAHFGEGLVRTPDNFGLRGEPPTHPELLDWLAGEFVRSGWSVKHLHRVIVNSAAYQQSSRPTPGEGREEAGSNCTPAWKVADPDNRLLSRFPRQRLEAEMVRDALLSVSGRLDLTMGGSLVTWGNDEYAPKDEVSDGSTRRSIYLPVVRDRLFDPFTIFDFPNPSIGASRRSPTVVSHQALFFLNSPFVKDCARAFVERLFEAGAEDEAGRVRLAYRRALGREPEAMESARAERFLSTVGGAGEDRRTRWVAFSQALLASNEFMFRD